MTQSTSRRPKWVGPLLALILVKGVLFLLLVPPWLGPDEGLRLEYARLFSQSGLSTLRPVSQEKNQAEILESMTRFGVWKYMDLPEPSPKGLRQFVESPLRKDTPSTTYPPLYYLVLGNLWRTLGIDGLLTQLYTGRVFSLALGWVQLVFLLLLAPFCWPPGDGWRKFCALAFMAFLPQWSYLTAVVHADNWSNLLASAFFLSYLHIAAGLEGPGDSPESAAKFRRKRLVLWSVTLVALFLALVLSTRVTAVVVAGVLLTAALLLLSRGRTLQRRRLLWILLPLGGVLVGLIVWLAVHQDAASGTSLEEAIGRGLMQRGAELPTEVGGTFLTRLGDVTPGGLIRSSAIIFMTFWLALGTLVQKLQPGWLVAAGAICLICLWGLLARSNRAEAGRVRSAWLLLLVAPWVATGAVLYVYGPHQSLAPEGRYLFLVLPLLSVLFVEGWRRFWPEKHARLLSEAWICGWILLNLVVLFRYVAARYYL